MQRDLCECRSAFTDKAKNSLTVIAKCFGLFRIDAEIRFQSSRSLSITSFVPSDGWYRQYFPHSHHRARGPGQLMVECFPCLFVFSANGNVTAPVFSAEFSVFCWFTLERRYQRQMCISRFPCVHLRDVFPDAHLCLNFGPFSSRLAFMLTHPMACSLSSGYMALTSGISSTLQRYGRRMLPCLPATILCANHHINSDVFTCVELNHDAFCTSGASLSKVTFIGSDSVRPGQRKQTPHPSGFPAYIRFPGIEGRAGYAGFILTDNKF